MYFFYKASNIFLNIFARFFNRRSYKRTVFALCRAKRQTYKQVLSALFINALLGAENAFNQ